MTTLISDNDRSSEGKPSTTDHIREEVEECPVCIQQPSAEMLMFGGFNSIRVCGHKICLGCDFRLKYTPNQFRQSDCPSIADNRYIKCPMCRCFEKLSYEDLEQERDYYKNTPPVNDNHNSNFTSNLLFKGGGS